MINIAILVSGNGTNLQAIIDAIDTKIINDAQISIIISNNKNAYALQRAKNIKSKFISSKDSHILLQTLLQNNIDLIVLAGYLPILPSDIILKYENKIINIHPSLIPSFCGKGFYGEKVHEAVLKAGVKITGATTHFVDCTVDTGKIIMQKAVEVYDNDTVETLKKRVLAVEHEILVKSIIFFCEKCKK